MRYTLLILAFIGSFSSAAEDVFQFNSSISFVPSYNEYKEGAEHSVDSFRELAFGFSYNTDFSELWRTNYGVGLTVSEPRLENSQQEIVYGAYASVDFEYQQFDDSIKPFVGMQFQQSLSDGKEHFHDDKLKKNLGLNFYSSDSDYMLRFVVSHVD